MLDIRLTIIKMYILLKLLDVALDIRIHMLLKLLNLGLDVIKIHMLAMLLIFGLV